MSGVILEKRYPLGRSRFAFAWGWLVFSIGAAIALGPGGLIMSAGIAVMLTACVEEMKSRE